MTAPSTYWQSFTTIFSTLFPLLLNPKIESPLPKNPKIKPYAPQSTTSPYFSCYSCSFCSRRMHRRRNLRFSTRFHQAIYNQVVLLLLSSPYYHFHLILSPQKVLKKKTTCVSRESTLNGNHPEINITGWKLKFYWRDKGWN